MGTFILLKNSGSQKIPEKSPYSDVTEYLSRTYGNHELVRMNWGTLQLSENISFEKSSIFWIC